MAKVLTLSRDEAESLVEAVYYYLCRAPTSSRTSHFAEQGARSIASAFGFSYDRETGPYELPNGAPCSKIGCPKIAVGVAWGSMKYYACEEHLPEIKALTANE